MCGCVGRGRRKDLSLALSCNLMRDSKEGEIYEERNHWVGGGQ